MSKAIKPTVKERIVAALDQLPPDRLAEVYDFVEFLRTRERAARSSKPSRRRRSDTLGQRLIESFEDVLAGRTRKITSAEDILRGD